MSGDYGEHIADLAGYGVGFGSLRDYEPYSGEDDEDEQEPESDTGSNETGNDSENALQGNVGTTNTNLSGGVKPAAENPQAVIQPLPGNEPARREPNGRSSDPPAQNFDWRNDAEAVAGLNDWLDERERNERDALADFHDGGQQELKRLEDNQ